jgi:transcriptional regulator with XRE-family HTH domain
MGKRGLEHHWTERSTDDFLYRIAADFVRQIESAMEAIGINQAGLAKRLKVSEGRVSQLLNNPGNLTLRKMVEYSRALSRKIAVVEYDDDDHGNLNGPISPEIFVKCWQKAGSPTDFLGLENAACNLVMYQIGPEPPFVPMLLKIARKAGNSGSPQAERPSVADTKKIETWPGFGAMADG